MTIIRIIMLLSVVLTGVILYLGAHDGDTWWLKCPLLQLTGWQCPLCGLQRAIHAFLHGNFAQAWHYNPALWFLLPYAAVILLGSVSTRISRSSIYARCSSARTLALVVLLLIIWGVCRNCC